MLNKKDKKQEEHGLKEPKIYAKIYLNNICLGTCYLILFNNLWNRYTLKSFDATNEMDK